MRTLDLLTSLDDYVSLLEAVKDKEISNPFEKKEDPGIFIAVVSLRYNFIMLKLEHGKKLPSSQRYMLSRYMECTFRIEQDKVSVATFYFQQKEREAAVKKFILENAPAKWLPGSKKNRYEESVVRSLSIADDIAQTAYQCEAGDNYSPGFYSEILIEQNRVILRQTNHWNSRSLDHREDYHLRDLEFFIPLQATEEKASSYDYRIETMFINFSDMSSKNNRSCGERLRQKMAEHNAVNASDPI
jgi:hypothetical protein